MTGVAGSTGGRTWVLAHVCAVGGTAITRPYLALFCGPVHPSQNGTRGVGERLRSMEHFRKLLKAAVELLRFYSVIVDVSVLFVFCIYLYSKTDLTHIG